MTARQDDRSNVSWPGVTLLVLAAPALAAWSPDRLQLFLGRLHPLLVHFPVALILVALLLETLMAARRRPERSKTARTCLLLGFLSAVAAGATGWLGAELEPPGPSEQDLVFWHRWVAVAVAGSALLAVLLGIGADGRKGRLRLHRLMLLIAGGLVAWCGHLGGSLVFGPDHLPDPFGDPEQSQGIDPDPAQGTLPAPPDGGTAQAPVSFLRDIQPIFSERCYACHGPRRHKGDLRLDQKQAVFGDDRELWVIQPMNPGASTLLELIKLPADDPERMPGRGPPLTERQIALIERWIREGADWP